MFIHTNQPLITSFYFKKVPIFCRISDESAVIRNFLRYGRVRHNLSKYAILSRLLRKFSNVTSQARSTETYSIILFLFFTKINLAGSEIFTNLFSSVFSSNRVAMNSIIWYICTVKLINKCYRRIVLKNF